MWSGGFAILLCYYYSLGISLVGFFFYTNNKNKTIVSKCTIIFKISSLHQLYVPDPDVYSIREYWLTKVPAKNVLESYVFWKVNISHSFRSKNHKFYWPATLDNSLIIVIIHGWFSNYHTAIKINLWFRTIQTKQTARCYIFV